MAAILANPVLSAANTGTISPVWFHCSALFIFGRRTWVGEIGKVGLGRRDWEGRFKQAGSMQPVRMQSSAKTLLLGTALTSLTDAKSGPTTLSYTRYRQSKRNDRLTALS